MKRSSSGHASLIKQTQDRHMEMTGRRNEDLLEVARALLLVQGAILVATTIEALLWGFVFAGAAGAPVWFSGAAAMALLVGRARLRADRRRTRRIVYFVEIVILVSLAVDTVLAVALAGALPPVVALLTQLVLPMSVVLLLRRSARAAAPATANVVMRSEGVT
jgi:hypothetical protein